MVRPKAQTLLITSDGTGEYEVMMADAVWAVMYQNTAISLARKTYGGNGRVVKYMRVNFSNPAHAYRLADRLNRLFDTDDFKVREINT
jgi:hypothetical protein